LGDFFFGYFFQIAVGAYTFWDAFFRSKTCALNLTKNGLCDIFQKTHLVTLLVS
jgi:hypothetical protein